MPRIANNAFSLTSRRGLYRSPLAASSLAFPFSGLQERAKRRALPSGRLSSSAPGLPAISARTISENRGCRQRGLSDCGLCVCVRYIYSERRQLSSWMAVVNGPVFKSLREQGAERIETGSLISGKTRSHVCVCATATFSAHSVFFFPLPCLFSYRGA